MNRFVKRGIKTSNNFDKLSESVDIIIYLPVSRHTR